MESPGRPPRSPTNATVCPVFGFHAGDVLAPLPNVMRFGCPPSASTTNRSGFPSIEEQNMIFVPSGENTGALLLPENRGKAGTFPVSREQMQMCGLTTLRSVTD